jgi:hypothetical protein
VLVAAVAFAGAFGCVDRSPVAPNADVLIVQSVLDAGARDQYVVVQATDGAIAQQTAVDGATVTLELPDGRVLSAVAERDSGRVIPRSGEPAVGTVYHFALGTDTLTPGATYRLRIVTPDGRVATGATTIPSATPVPDVALDTVPFTVRDTLTLAWPRVRGASSYNVQILALGHEYSLFTDTSVAVTLDSLFAGSGDDQIALCGMNGVVVSAVDVNYYDYYRHKPDTFTGSGVISHLDGAIGVFGSIVAVDRRVLAVDPRSGPCPPATVTVQRR